MPLVIWLAAGAWASSVVPMNLRDLAAAAHRVVIGRITALVSEREPATGRIYSRLEVVETRSLTGTSLGTVSFRMAGGAVGDSRQWIAGFPNLRIGDEVVLFLAESTDTPFGPTAGLWQGVFFVERDGSGMETVSDHLRRPIAAVEGDRLIRAPEPAPGRAAQSGGPRLSLAAFLDHVRALRGLARAAGR